MIEIELKQKTATASQTDSDQTVLYSKKIIHALKEKVKRHNATATKKVYFYQLKDVYISGASEPTISATPNISGWARVNMYLRMLQEISSMAHAANEEAKKVVSKNILDFSCLLRPIEQDFVQAKEDIIVLGVNFDFGDVGTLYLDEVEPISSYYQRFL